MTNIPDDIPEARRESPRQPVAPRPAGRSQGPTTLWWVGLVAIVALGAGSLAAWSVQRGNGSLISIGRATAASSSDARAALQDSFAQIGMPMGENLLLGHRPYDEAPPETLVSIVADGSIQLRQPAADQFMEMQAAARAAGVNLIPLSGFRSVEYQQYLFFDIKAQQGQVARERAEVSAPPGYSEHHTGYAIDVGDLNQPETHLEQSFENTAAFRWMEQNAPLYNFELSFEAGNASGVSYEPWHWRFVGDRNSLETFYGSGSPSRSSPATSSAPGAADPGS